MRIASGCSGQWQCKQRRHRQLSDRRCSAESGSMIDRAQLAILQLRALQGLGRASRRPKTDARDLCTSMYERVDASTHASMWSHGKPPLAAACHGQPLNAACQLRIDIPWQSGSSIENSTVAVCLVYISRNFIPRGWFHARVLVRASPLLDHSGLQLT